VRVSITYRRVNNDEGDYYRVLVHDPRRLGQRFATLAFPLKRRAEGEVLREGQEITYEGQIRRASENGVHLVHVEILPTT